MTTDILEKPTAWDIAMDLEVILTTLRVTNELMLEPLLINSAGIDYIELLRLTLNERILSWVRET